MLDEMLAEKLVLRRILEAEFEEIGAEAVADLQGSHWANVGPDAKETIDDAVVHQNVEVPGPEAVENPNSAWLCCRHLEANLAEGEQRNPSEADRVEGEQEIHPRPILRKGNKEIHLQLVA